MSTVELSEARKQLDEHLSKGWIIPSTSHYRSPIIFARKKDGNLRISLDYRALNQYTKPDKYLLPRIDDLLDRLANVHCLSSNDLYTGYY